MGTAERREREKQKRINDILDAALDVFADKGLSNATMDDVADKAEISKGTIYLYFKSKEHLFYAIDDKAAKMLMDRFIEASKTEDIGLEKVKAIGRAYYKFSFDFPSYFKAMSYIDNLDGETFKKITEEMSPSGMRSHKATSLSILAEAIKTGHEDGSISKDFDPWITSVLLWSTSNGVIQMLKNRSEILKTMDFDIDKLYPSKELMVAFGLYGKKD